MGILPFQNNYWYIGWCKQSVQGTALAPTQFWRWQSGTTANPQRKVSVELEGDGSPFENFAYTEHQYQQIKISEYFRPIGIGCALEAIMASGSDSYTAPTKNTTLAANIVAGATTFQSTADLGNVGTLAMNFSPGFSSTTYEVQTVNLVSRTGAGPYTYTLASSATFAKAHTNGDTITSVAQHVFTRQTAGYDFYTIEWGFTMPGGVAKSFRAVDCVCTDLKITGEQGKPLKAEHTWWGITTSVPTSQASPVYEGANVGGATGGPFMFYQNAGTLRIDGSASGNAVTIRKFELSMKNSTGEADLQNEGFTTAMWLPGTVSYDLALEAHFQNYNQYAETYLGTNSIGTGSTDSSLTGIGAFAGTFNTDAINSLALSVPNAAYMAAALEPKTDGKALLQPMTMKPFKNGGVVPVTVTLSNSQASSY